MARYTVGEAVEAERFPFTWYRGTVEQVRPDSYAVRFEGSAAPTAIAAAKIRSVGSVLSATPSRAARSASPTRSLTSPTRALTSPQPSLELRSASAPDLARRVQELSEQCIRERAARRQLEERLLACEHRLGGSGEADRLRRDDGLARLERRLDDVERSTKAELQALQRKVSDALVELKRVQSVRSRAAPLASSSTPRPSQELQAEAHAILSSRLEKLEAQAGHGGRRVSPPPSRSSPSPFDGRYNSSSRTLAAESDSGALAAVESRVMQAVEARLEELDETMAERAAESSMMLQGDIAQACAEDMEGLRAEMADIAGNGDGSSPVAEQLAGLERAIGEQRSVVAQHTEVIERLVLEKAEDVAAPKEKLQELMTAQEILHAEYTLARREDRLGPSGSGSGSGPGASSDARVDEVESNLLQTITQVGSQLAERVSVLEGAVSPADLEEAGGESVASRLADGESRMDQIIEWGEDMEAKIRAASS